MKRILLTVTLSLLILSQIQSQCQLFSSADQNNIDCGDSITVTLNGFSNVSLSETFSSTGPNDPGWAYTTNAMYTNPYIPSPTNDTYFWMGPISVLPAALTTTGYDVSLGGQICFDFVYASGTASPIEQPDEYDEGITLQYSTNGGTTWNDIVYYAPNGDVLPNFPGIGVNTPGVGGVGPFETWQSVCITLPAGALTTNTAFQWIQLANSGSCCDNWGLDNIYIYTADPAYAYFNENWNLLPANVAVEYPTGDSTYTYYFTDGINDTCSTTIDLFVNETDAGPDILVSCDGLGSPLCATGVAPWATVSWSPIDGILDANSACTTVFPFQDQVYTLTTDCGVDTVSVFLEDAYTINFSQPDTICVNGFTPISLTTSPSTVPVSMFEWSNGNSLNVDSGNAVVATPSTTTTYIVTATSDSGCVIQDSVTVYVQGLASQITILPENATVCKGSSIDLTIGYPDSCAYQLVPINYNPYPITGTVLGGFSDDNVQGPLPIGFNFPYFCGSYSNLWLGSNGFFTVSANTNTGLGNQTLPSTVAPNGIIAWCLEDLNWNTSGTFSYYVAGTAPNRYLVLNFIDVSHYASSVKVSAQVVLYENGTIEMYNISILPDNTFATMTQGIENNDGTVGYAIDTMNNTAFTSVQQAYAYIPFTAPTNPVITWSPSTFLSSTTGSMVTATPDSTIEYTVVMQDGFCQSMTTGTINVPEPYVNILEDTLIICQLGDTVEAHLVVDSLDAPSCVQGYDITTIPVTMLAPTAPVSVSLGDDQVSPYVNLTFPFDFFCEPKAQYNISSNGFMSFNNTASGCCTGQNLPNVNTPNELIALYWSDLNPNTGGTISHWTTGTAPNRIEVIEFNGISHFGSAANMVTGQIQLHEFQNVIEIHCQNCMSDGGIITMGLENADGTNAYPVPGHNASSAAAVNQAWRFTPQGLGQTYTTMWSPLTWVESPTSDTTRIATPNSQFYYVDVTTGGDNCVYTDSVFVGTQVLLTSGNDTICSGDTTQIFAFGAPSVTWTPNDGSLSNVNITNPLAYPTTTTTYQVSASLNGCSVSNELTIEVSQTPVASINGGAALEQTCNGYTVGLSSDNTDATWTYNWTGPETGNTSSINVGTTGNYTLAVSNDFGCTDSDDIDVQINDNPTLDATDVQNVLCCNESVTVDLASLISNSSQYAQGYWDGSTTPSAGTETVTGFEIGAYGSTMDVNVTIVDQNGCVDSVMLSFYNACNQIGIYNVDTVILGDSVAYQFVTDTTPDQIVWYPTDAFTQNTFVANGNYLENVDIIGEISNTYTLNNGDSRTCVDSSTTSIYVKTIADPEMPDAFTPNGDGLNDKFFPVNLDINSNISTFNVYNRWGDLVYSYNGDNGWDGKFENVDQPTDVYNYYVVIDKGVEQFITSGTVTLIR